MEQLNRVIQELEVFVLDDTRDDALIPVKLQRLRMWLRLLGEVKKSQS